MGNDKKLLIVSMNKKAAIFLKSSLEKVFKDKVEIIDYSFLEQSLNELHDLLNQNPNLVLATGSSSFENISKYYSNDKIILGSREVSEPEYFDKLFLIPPNKKVLVVNETESGTLETIESLEALGIKHLNYVPYWSDCNKNIDSIDTAITVGMTYLCPKSIPNKIDIGMRRLSINTFIKILNVFELDLDYIDKYIGEQKILLIDTYRKLSVEYLRAEKLKNSLQIIINSLDEAIISINENKEITEFNIAAEKIFQRKKESVLYTDIGKLFNTIPEIELPDNFENFNTIATITGKQIYISYTTIGIETSDEGIFILREIYELQKKEEHVRKLLYKKNYGYVAKYTFDDIVSENEQIELLIQNAKFLSKTESTVLITGESGTGKELFAQSIHNYSNKSENPFVAVNFAALPETLIESELFGYDEGAFTGARKSGKKGLFELAQSGTIFLDEIGDSSMWVQARLLRVLEEKEIMRLGDTKMIPIDVRVITATNKDLKKLVDEGKFRADLYYRINVFQLHIPPLRERKSSIPALIKVIMEKYNINKTFSSDALAMIVNYPWEGNVRELKNMVEYSSLMSKTNIINIDDFPYDIKSYIARNDSLTIPENKQIYCELIEKFNINHVIHVLHIIDSNKNNLRKLGRKPMISLLANYDVHISESSLRTMLKHLEDYGLISIGKTKQGTTLSPKGEKLLDYLENII